MNSPSLSTTHFIAISIQEKSLIDLHVLSKDTPMMGKVPVSGVDFDLREETDSGSVLELLLSVSSDGDLDTVKQMLEKLLASPDFRSLRTSGEPFTKLGAALRAAVANQKLDVADYLIRSGVLITEDVVQLAVELESTKALDLLLDHGWDINDRWDRFRRPSIW